jgi:plastocyanin
MKRLALVLVFAAACGGSSSNPTPDAAVSTAKVVTCPAAPAQTIAVNAGGTAFVPSTASIHVNDIVQFTGGASHPVVSGTGSPDGKFNLSSGAGCVQFTAAGTFPFFCNVHGFTGTITVQ